MSLTPAILDAMLAAGASAEIIVAAVKADLIERAAVAVQRRMADADRQRRSRLSRNVTVTGCDIRDAETGPLSPLNEISNSPLTPTPLGECGREIDLIEAAPADPVIDPPANPPTKPEASPAADPPAKPKSRGPRLGNGKGGFHPLPLGWVPVRDLPESLEAKRDGWPPGWFAEQLESFRDWATNASDRDGVGLKKDWDAAWHNWLRRKIDDRAERAGGWGSDRDFKRINGGSFVRPDQRNYLAEAAERLAGSRQ